MLFNEAISEGVCDEKLMIMPVTKINRMLMFAKSKNVCKAPINGLAQGFFWRWKCDKQDKEYTSHPYDRCKDVSLPIRSIKFRASGPHGYNGSHRVLEGKGLPSPQITTPS
jgi:hypothetical protein